ncbi:protein amnionless-like isoform X2 [Branchiostoma floridae]|uniref:Protein amnionless n=1 Tax=Branchiostoma floridae TaxID=7739 RepID=A0A9J7L2W4_BRAFL|nr:protein amnionless-like isoform X2 [Branchiostoma floridae]
MGTVKLRAKLPLLLLLLAVLSADGAKKIWLKNTNWMNSANWDRGSPPCSKQVVSFQEKPNPYAVFVQNDVSVGELVLPLNGEIVFADDLKVNFGSFTDDPACMAGDNRFVGGEPGDWLNPHNWRVEDDGNLVEPMSPEDDSSPTSPGDDTDGFPVLHAEVVPCTHDTVVFPENATYLVRLDHSKQVKHVDFTGKVYKRKPEFHQFLRSENGEMQFKLGPSGDIAVMGQDCKELSGCYCGNEEHMDLICDLYGDNCPPLTCSSPITPRGSCCPMCGSVLLLNYDDTFDIMAFQDRLVVDFVPKVREYTGRVKGRVSKLADGHVQLVLVDDVSGARNGMAAVEVGEHVASVIERDMGPYPTYGVKGLTIKNSGIGNVAQVARGSGGNTVLYIAAGAGGGAVFFIAILVSLVIIMKKRRADSEGGQNGASVRKPPMPAGAGRPGAAGQAGGGAGPSGGDKGADKGFENPVYDNPIKDNPLYADIPDDP